MQHSYHPVVQIIPDFSTNVYELVGETVLQLQCGEMSILHCQYPYNIIINVSQLLYKHWSNYKRKLVIIKNISVTLIQGVKG